MHKINVFFLTIHSEVIGVSNTKLGLCLNMNYLLCNAEFLSLLLAKIYGKNGFPLKT